MFLSLIFIYLWIIHKIDVFQPIKNLSGQIGRSVKVRNFNNRAGKQPVDIQKAVFKEGIFIVLVILIMLGVGSKMIFFSAVVSGSMVPTFYRGDMILMQNIDRTYSVGDIIMFKRPDTNLPYSHRIWAIRKEGIITKGDATDTIDWWRLKKENILGKAIQVNGKPIVIKGYGNYFIISDEHQDFGPFGNDYRKYQLFFQVVRIYGYVIAALCLIMYVMITARKKSWQS